MSLVMVTTISGAFTIRYALFIHCDTQLSLTNAHLRDGVSKNQESWCQFTHLTDGLSQNSSRRLSESKAGGPGSLLSGSWCVVLTSTVHMLKPE